MEQAKVEEKTQRAEAEENKPAFFQNDSILSHKK